MLTACAARPPFSQVLHGGLQAGTWRTICETFCGGIIEDDVVYVFLYKDDVGTCSDF